MENSVTDVIEGGEHGWRVSWIREDGEFFHHPSFHPHLAVHGHGAASREGCGKCPVVAHRLCRDMWIIEEGDDCDEGEAVVSAGGWRILADDGQFRFIVMGEPCAKVRRVF